MVIYTFGGGKVNADVACASIKDAKHGTVNDDQVFALIQKLFDYQLAEIRYCLDGRRVFLVNGWKEVMK